MSLPIREIKKRDGRIVKFEQKRITDAIHRAMVAVAEKDGRLAKRLSDEVVGIIERRFVGRIPSVEDAQDIVIGVLGRRGYQKVAGEYLAYRKKKEEIRELKEKFGIEREPKLTVNALEVLKKRYLLRDENGNIIEAPAQMFYRVAEAIAKVDRRYGEDWERSYREFYGAMSRLEFLPNSPTLFNAGAPLGQLSACFVLPVEDSLESIFTAVKDAAIIEKTGGGVGFDFSKIRPRGDIVRSTKGVASGPVSFMRVFDTVTETIKAGGKRRGAMMGILRIDHPDIREFITAKLEGNLLKNFNISVAVTDDFMRRVEENEDYQLINPRTGLPAEKVNARKIWRLIVESAWRGGDPGLVFIDEINRHNPTPTIGRIEATNPCGEVPLLPYESCNLGSINLSKMAKETNGGFEVDWEKLEKTVRTGVRFLDNVIDANNYPMPQIQQMTLANRKIGLGVMGWAELLIKLQIPYDSEKAVRLAERVMSFISEKAREESAELGRKRGSFPNFEKSIWHGKYDAMRNAALTSIAPTGSISIIAGCSSGIEPLFAVSFMRKVLEGSRLFEVNPLFEKIAKEEGFYGGKLLEEVAKSGSLKDVKGIPRKVKRIFVTALDIKPEWHVKMQAAFQKYVDNAVSKTINFPRDATVKDVENVYRMAWRMKCKGITVYRYGSKPEQVLYIGKTDKTSKYATAEPEYAGGCLTGVCPLTG